MEKQIEFYVYVLEENSTGYVFYCGKGRNTRMFRHRAIAKSGKNNHLYNKIRLLWKNDDDYSPRIVFRTFIEDEAFLKEMELIAIFGRENLCNLTDGGDGGYGKKHSEETKKKIGDSKRGKKYSQERRDAMKGKLEGKRRERWDESFQANPKRVEYLKENSKRQRKKILNKTTGEIFESICAAAKAYDTNTGCISSAVRLGFTTSGCKWEFYQEENSSEI